MNLLSKISSAFALAAFMSACGGDSDEHKPVVETSPSPEASPSPNAELFEVSDIDTGTRSLPKTVYYDLDSASIVELSEEEAETNADWDIAFNRTKVYLNRFADTPVSIYFTANTGDFYDAEGKPVVERFNNATAETELDAFLALDPTIPADDEFSTDSAEAVISSWYSYDVSTHTVSADAESFFLVRSDAGLARFSVSELVQNSMGMDSIRFSVQLQASDVEMFDDAFDIDVNASACDSAVYVDLHLGMTVTADDGWDISIPCSDNLLNFDINIADDRTATNDPSYADVEGIPTANIGFMTWLPNIEITSAYATQGDANAPYGWGNYGVNDGHLLWSNFATYIVKTDAANYKFQITAYYDAEGNSGTYSFRYIELPASE
ncbi:HmuY family protein [Agaribacterium sp. ZY112]|uniref:HmuY family protein n=1 Tax=Agaribacterium sp. ZY112 TaxID=3233574 RepID=UPI0035264F59